jgi:hypothetical protein
VVIEDGFFIVGDAGFDWLLFVGVVGFGGHGHSVHGRARPIQ